MSWKRETEGAEAAEGMEGVDLEEEDGGRRGPQRPPSSPPLMADGGPVGEDGGLKYEI
jgi:hypothetical protein